MNDNYMPRVVMTISFTIAIILLTLIFSYSYLLIQMVAEKNLLTEELINVRLQLEDEREKRFLTEQDKNQLNQQIQSLRSQILQTEIKQCPICEPIELENRDDSQICRVDYKEINSNFLHQASLKTLSRSAPERFEGFSVLMDNIDYMTDQEQRELVQFYLKKIDPSHKEGVYYAAFIMSELRPEILREYEVEIQEAYRFISYNEPGWEHTSYRYCQLENKLNTYLH